MKKIEKYSYKIVYRFSNKSRVKIARKLGVNFTEPEGEERCNILTDPFSLFGTEPYLITVGRHVEFTLGVRLVTHDGGMWVFRENTEMGDCDFFGPIRIGDNVFIGNNAIVLPGVNIGNNCVIGAGTIVSKDVPDNSVVAGVPARIIKTIDGYAQKIQQSGIVRSKGLSPTEKEMMIRRVHPEWF